MITKIVCRRVKKFLDNGDTYMGGDTDEKENYIGPTILHNIKTTDSCMQEEVRNFISRVICFYYWRRKQLNIRAVNKRRPPTKWSATLQLWSATFLQQDLVLEI